jgi:polysaccharide pyruvyl transferase CsaB
MGLAQKMGLKTIAWAQGIGPLNSPITRAIAQRCFKGCTAVSVRDAGSASLLANWKIPFTLAPDPVWALDSLPVVGLENLPTPRVAVNLRSHSTLTSERLAILTQALIEFQKVTKTFILLLPFQPSQDLPIAQEIHQKIPQNSQILSLTNPRELKGIFKGVNMTIGMRLHCIIMAAAAGCNCFPLSYDPKVTNLMDELEMTGYLLSDLPNDPARISQGWIEYYTKGERLSKYRIKYLVDRALIHQELLRENLS